MTIYSSTTLAELLDELEMGSPHMGAAIRERVTELQDELDASLDAEPNWGACPYCEETRPRSASHGSHFEPQPDEELGHD